MNLRVATCRLGSACVLAAILAAPLAAQNANNPNSQTGNQGVNDVLPLLVVLTGPQNWTYIGSATGLGGSTNGGGGGQWMLVADSPEPPPLPAFDAEAHDAAASITTTDGRTFKDVKILKLLPRVGDGLIIGDRALLVYAGGSATVPLASLGDEARRSLGLEMPAKPPSDPAAAQKRRAEREAKFWADLKLLVRDWRDLDANPKLLDWVMKEDLGDALDRRERARALANWLVKQWEPWEARNIDPRTGRPGPLAEALPPAPY